MAKHKSVFSLKNIILLFVIVILAGVVIAQLIIKKGDVVPKRVGLAPPSEWCNGADVDHSGGVNSDDYFILDSNNGRIDCTSANAWCNGADVDHSGGVNSDDYFILDSNNGRIDCAGGNGGIVFDRERVPLFNQIVKLLPNKSLNALYFGSGSDNSISDEQLPLLLADGAVESIGYSQWILVGNSKLVFSKQPTSFDDPSYLYYLNSGVRKNVYREFFWFNPLGIDFSRYKGSSITLFGNSYVIDDATKSLSLVLRKEGEIITLESGSPVKVGGLRTPIPGTYVEFFVGSSGIGGVGKLLKPDGRQGVPEVKYVVDGVLIHVFAPDSDHDALRQGGLFVDPVFKTFAVDFREGMNIPDADSTNREDIKIQPLQDDKVTFTLRDHRGLAATQIWARDMGSVRYLHGDNGGHNITVVEMAKAYRNDIIMVGRGNTGKLVKVYSIVNQTSGYGNDKVKFTDVFSGDT